MQSAPKIAKNGHLAVVIALVNKLGGRAELTETEIMTAMDPCLSLIVSRSPEDGVTRITLRYASPVPKIAKEP